MRRARLSQPVWNFSGLIEQQSLILETYEKHVKVFCLVTGSCKGLVDQVFLKHVLDIIINLFNESKDTVVFQI